MTTEAMHRLGKADPAQTSLGAWTKGVQAIAVEVVEYSKKSADCSVAAWEKLMGAKSLDKAIEVQSDYLKSAYQDFVGEATRLGELYFDLAREAYKPFESALSRVSAAK